MKKAIMVSILLLITVHFAVGELTEKDLEKISDLLDKQEKRIKEYVDLKIEAVRAEIEAVRAEIKAVKAQIEYIKWFITALIVIIVALIGIPQTVQLWRERKESKKTDMFVREIERVNHSYERLEQRYEKLEQEMEDLKKRKFYAES